MGMEIPVLNGAAEAETGAEEEEEEGEQVIAVVSEEDEQQQQQQQQQAQRATRDEVRELRALKARPSILLVGPAAVGKRTLLNRLIARGRSVKATSESGAICHGWTIDTKYYTANVCLWTVRLGSPTLEDATSINSEFGRCEALIMVFDLSSPNSLEQLQDWVTGLEMGTFEILLCVGNKADRVPEHFGHAEYRRKLQRRGESSSHPHPEFLDFGIERSEGSSLLGEEVVSLEDRRRACIEWCSDMGIEYIEACAINEVFDECMSIDGDLQGVSRIHGALSAHMWPGLIMKDGSESNDATPSTHEQEGPPRASTINPGLMFHLCTSSKSLVRVGSSSVSEMTSDDDSDYYIEYELLSNGSAEPWEAPEWEEQWSFSPHVDEGAPQSDGSMPKSIEDTLPNLQADKEQTENTFTSPVSEATDKSSANGSQVPQMQTSGAETSSNGHIEHPVGVQNGHGDPEVVPTRTAGQMEHKNQELEDMEQLMREMSNMRLNMQSMSDQHRREMAAQMALRMASMFKEDQDEESVFE